ncbi:MAG TPA: hypothetical protein VN493_18505 [Thermoanaerobaculia bacterium]|nr:hypothetical protein [Thermoanaerobaculia bacterium]
MLRAGQYASVHERSGTWYGQVHAAPLRSGGDYRIRVGGTDRVVTVPWTQVGLHSAFATRSPRLRRESNEKIDRVLAAPELLRIDTCTAAMREIMLLLGTGIGTAVDGLQGTSPDGLYRLVVNFGGDINTNEHNLGGWEHGMVFQKVGNEVVYYQAWVGSFTLEEWLLLKPRALCLSSAIYSPRHPSFHPQLMDQFFRGLADLPRQWDAVVERGMDVAVFSMATAYLFGPESTVGTMQLRTSQSAKARLRYHWRYAAFR